MTSGKSDLESLGKETELTLGELVAQQFARKLLANIQPQHDIALGDVQEFKSNKRGDHMAGVILPRLLGSSSKNVFIVGAGISQSAGIKTAKDPNAPAAYKKIFKFIAGYQADPIWRKNFEDNMVAPALKACPSLFHAFLAALSHAGALSTIFSQNVDGLEVRAGLENPVWDATSDPTKDIPPFVPLHGSVLRLRGTACIHAIKRTTSTSIGEQCPACDVPRRKAGQRKYKATSALITDINLGGDSSYNTFPAYSPIEVTGPNLLVFVVGTSLPHDGIKRGLKALLKKKDVVSVWVNPAPAPDEFDFTFKVKSTADVFARWIVHKAMESKFQQKSWLNCLFRTPWTFQPDQRLTLTPTLLPAFGSREISLELTADLFQAKDFDHFMGCLYLYGVADVKSFPADVTIETMLVNGPLILRDVETPLPFDAACLADWTKGPVKGKFRCNDQKVPKQWEWLSLEEIAAAHCFMATDWNADRRPNDNIQRATLGINCDSWLFTKHMSLQHWLYAVSPGGQIWNTWTGQGYCSYYQVRTGTLAMLLSMHPVEDHHIQLPPSYSKFKMPMQALTLQAGECLVLPPRFRVLAWAVTPAVVLSGVFLCTTLLPKSLEYAMEDCSLPSDDTIFEAPIGLGPLFQGLAVEMGLLNYYSGVSPDELFQSTMRLVYNQLQSVDDIRISAMPIAKENILTANSICRERQSIRKKLEDAVVKFTMSRD